ncbi:hypothetical protein HG536_0G00320 [Torulaspora globosa]|uniref:Uncharacterized protein n=1 Tax=Torulaspora globosa TaxID=48254 RepID=A0A7G3ZKY9_9SACH|nr:uncharacterized protein HG536_0G00320 [Torulaspora globosa]QLL34175.1 hypothetical protein HG536_0G00320 [Torulaspora globosa]
MFRRSLSLGFAACRHYSHAAAKTGSKKSGFDKSMLKPALAVIVFASMLSHVSNQQNVNAELDRRYELKIGILEKLIERAKHGDRDFDPHEELKLVNKLFARFSSSKGIDLEDEAAKVRKYSDARPYSEEMIINSLNGSAKQVEEESLEEVLKSLMNEVDGKGTMTQPSPPESSFHEKGEVVLNKKLLDELARKEAELLNYSPSTDAHTLVENPGELTAAAKDTEVPKFL